MKATPLPTDHWTFSGNWSADLYNAPETDLLAVADHDFRGLSSPILVACQDREQFNEFCFREGLLCSEVRRLSGRREDLISLRADKILILLPGWDEHGPTRALAEKWIYDLDRYTVHLRSPRPLAAIARAWPLIIALSLLAWLALAWLVTR